jgi:hypothetical protein
LLKVTGKTILSVSPWTRQKDEDGDHIIFDADSYHIATVKGIISLMTDRNDVLAPAANAALIAAAPEMLEALKELINAYNGLDKNGLDLGTVQYGLDSLAYRSALNAIAKAEGNHG